MSLFKIKLQTKAGNDVKNKQSFNVVFKSSFKKNAITQKITGHYTFKIIYSKNIKDFNKVFTIKDTDNLINKYDLTIKVVINLITLVINICKKENINADLIMLNSSDFTGSPYLRNQLINCAGNNVPGGRIYHKLELTRNYKMFNLLVDLCASQQNTRFMFIDPNSSPEKYIKSIEISNMLTKRLNNVGIDS